MDTVRLNNPHVKMVAHRGLSGLECENTCAAFVAAGNRSYYGVETDVHVTNDGAFVVFHDDTLSRLTDVNWCIEECSLKQLRSVRLKDRDGAAREDLCIPTLEEYIRICKKYGKKCVLELKNHFNHQDIVSIISIIRELEWLEETIFISFDLANLVTVRELLPQQKAQYLVDEIKGDLLNTLACYRLDVDAYYGLLSSDFVKAVHEVGCEVNAWTVDVLADANRLIEMEVDYITTNVIE